MSVAVIHMSKINPNSTTASTRIAKFLVSRLGGCPLIDREGAALDATYDTVIIVNSPTAFSSILEQVTEMALKAKRLVWVMNDYTLYPPTQLRDALDMRKMELWGTLPRLSDRLAARWTYRNLPQDATHYIDWNKLTYEPRPLTDWNNPGLFYYGAFREFRRDDFEKYFDTTEYRSIISTSDKQIEKFEECCPKAEVIGPQLDLIGALQTFQASIYIEDTHSHGMYCSPANRFYEMLSAGCFQLFDNRCIATFRSAGIEMDTCWFVDGPKDVKRMLDDDPGEHARIQAMRMRRDYRAELEEQVQKAVATL